MKKFYKVLCVLAAAIVCAALIRGALVAPSSARFPEGDAEKIIVITKDDWTELSDGGYAYTIPEDLAGAQVLEITSSWASLEIWLDGELIYSQSDPYRELGRIAHWIDIPAGSCGKQVIFTSDSDAETVADTLKYENYIGTADAIRHNFFMRNLPMLLLTIVEAVMAGAVLLIYAVLRRKLSPEYLVGMSDLFLFITLNALWMLSDSGLMQCATSKTAIWSLVSFVCFMLMPVFMLRFTRGFLNYYRRALDILTMASLILTSLSLFLYIRRIKPIDSLLGIHQVLMFVDIAVLLYSCCSEIRRYRIRRLVTICNGIVLMGVFVVASMFAFYQDNYILYPLLYGSGFVCFIVFLIMAVVRQAFYNLGKNAEMATYRELAFKDVMTMIYNRAAFAQYQETDGKSVSETAYIMLDINGLKTVNDTMGHQAGDDLIMRAGECIRETFEQAGTCYRVGGDEFVVVLKKIREEKEIKNLLQHFNSRVKRSNWRLDASRAPLSMAYGYSFADSTARTGEDLYKEADQWMYRRKRMMKRKKAAV